MRINSGDLAPKTGEYKIIESSGKSMGTVHVKKGDKMPPTQTKTQHFEID